MKARMSASATRKGTTPEASMESASTAGTIVALLSAGASLSAKHKRNCAGDDHGNNNDDKTIANISNTNTKSSTMQYTGTGSHT